MGRPGRPRLPDDRALRRTVGAVVTEPERERLEELSARTGRSIGALAREGVRLLLTAVAAAEPRPQP